MYMLDTNIVSDAMRHPLGSCARRMEAVGHRELGISVVVSAELRFGVMRRAASTQLARLEALLAFLSVLPLPIDTDRHYARIRAALEQRGIPIGANDLWIAAHALAVGAMLVTDNVREFARVDGLAIENWLRD